MLLSDTRVAAYLKENFVCAWESVAPVPQVTIEFGNGKSLQRTLGGNTVLYVVTPDGRVADAFPGVYTPEDFLTLLTESLGAFRAASTPQTGLASEPLRSFHAERAAVPVGRRLANATKGMVESPLLRSTRLKATFTAPEQNNAPRRSFVEGRKRIEDLSKSPATVNEISRALGLPDGVASEERGRRIVQADSQLSVTNLRPMTHAFFAGRATLPTVAEARDALFTTVLQLNLKDPYLGLADADVPGTPTLR